MPKIDLNHSSLHLVFRPYEAHTMERLWADREGEEKGYGSGRMWVEVNEDLDPETISRASVIFFLNRLVDQKVCDWKDKTGKGGHHRIYHIAMDREGYWRWLTKMTIEKLVEASEVHIKELLPVYEDGKGLLQGWWHTTG